MLFQDIIPNAGSRRFVVIGIFQDSDGHILGLPASAERVERLRQFAAPDVVVNQNKVRTEFHQPLHYTPQVKGYFRYDPAPADLIKFLKGSGEIDRVIAYQQHV